MQICYIPYDPEHKTRILDTKDFTLPTAAMAGYYMGHTFTPFPHRIHLIDRSISITRGINPVTGFWILLTIYCLIPVADYSIKTIKASKGPKRLNNKDNNEMAVRHIGDRAKRNASYKHHRITNEGSNEFLNQCKNYEKK